MLIAKGRKVAFDLVGGEQVDAPAAHALLHDASGRYWPKTHLLIGPITPGPLAKDPPADADRYLGRDHDVHEDRADLPPRTGWTKLGDVATIYYERTGKRRISPTRKKAHRFGADHLSRFLFGEGRAVLYERGAWLELRLSVARGPVVLDAGDLFGFP